MRPLDVILALSVPVIWGMGFTFAKAAIGEFPPILLMCLRFFLTALVLVWFVKRPTGIMKRLFLIALISAAIQYGLTFYGLKFLDASTAILVVQLEVPFCTLLAVVFLKETLTKKKLFGMAVAFAGVAMIAGEPRLAGNWLGIWLTVGGAFSWAIGQVMIRSLGQVGGFTMIAWIAVFASSQLLVASLLIEAGQWQAIQSASWIVWGTVIYMGVIMTALGYGIWYHLLGRYEVGKVVPFLLLLPVVTVIASVLLLDEKLTVLLVVGGMLVMAGVAVIVVERNPGRLKPLS